MIFPNLRAITILITIKITAIVIIDTLDTVMALFDPTALFRKEEADALMPPPPLLFLKMMEAVVSRMHNNM